MRKQHTSIVDLLKQHRRLQTCKYKVLCLLQNAWGDRQLPAIFDPNPLNKSAKTMQKICGEDVYIMFGNTTSVVTTSASGKAPIDQKHLKLVFHQMRYLKIDMLLICGKQAEKAFKDHTGEVFDLPFLYLPHPACRNLSNVQILEFNKKINQILEK